MTHPLQRLLNIAIVADEEGNALVGGKPRETISGSAGRALGARRWWAPAAVAAINAVFGQNHCQDQAGIEDERRHLTASMPAKDQ